MAMKPIAAATRTNEIKYAVRDIVVLAQETAKSGKEMLYLNIGDPNIFDHETPKHMIEATYKAMLKNLNGYAPSSGISGAVESIEKDAERKGIKNIQDIFITTGASEAIELCLTALVNSGENVLLPTPGYPLYTAVQSKLEMVANPYYLDEENDWQPDIEDIKSKINEKTRAIILINPNNPTGSIYKKETLLQIIELAKEHNLIIFSDEIYDKLLFDGQDLVSIASLDHDVPIITFGGLSKNYVVPGFRIGWGIVSGDKAIVGDFLEGLNKLLRARLSANHPEQYAIIEALNGDQQHIANLVAKLEKRRDLTVQMMNDIEGVNLVKPNGAFYAFPTIDVDDDWEFTKGLIAETGVVVVPGAGFGQKPGSHHIRLVILPPEDKLEKAYKYIGSYLQKFNNR